MKDIRCRLGLHSWVEKHVDGVRYYQCRLLSHRPHPRRRTGQLVGPVGLGPATIPHAVPLVPGT
jgi:hypothetical protein